MKKRKEKNGERRKEKGKFEKMLQNEKDDK